MIFFDFIKNNLSSKFYVIFILPLLLSVVFLIPINVAQSIDDNPSCRGMSYTCNDSCSDTRSVSDTDYSYIHSAWRGSYFSWDDDASYTIGYSGPGSFSFSDHSQSINNRKWVCSCGDASGCPGTSWPLPYEFFNQGLRRTYGGGKFTVYASVHALQKRNRDLNPYSGEVAFGYAIVTCSAGEMAQFPPYSSAFCGKVSGKIDTNQSSCFQGSCSAVINWSATVAKDKTWVYVNDRLWATGGLRDSKNAGSDLNSWGPGTYTFGLRAKDGYDNEYPLSGYLATVTITVNSSSPPKAELNAYWKENNSQSIEKTITQGQSIQIPFIVENIGQIGSVINNIQCILSNTSLGSISNCPSSLNK